MDTQNKLVELKDICDKAFKRNSIYPLMEIPKPDSKGTIEEILNDVYIEAENAKKEMQDEIVSKCINCIIRTVRKKKIEHIYTCKLFPLNTDIKYKDIIGTYEECKDIIHSKKCEYNPF